MHLVIMTLLHFCKEPNKKNKLMQKKKEMMEQEKEANWKKIQEIDYNLNSKYMDYEDKWRKALG